MEQLESNLRRGIERNGTNGSKFYVRSSINLEMAKFDTQMLNQITIHNALTFSAVEIVNRCSNDTTTRITNILNNMNLKLFHNFTLKLYRQTRCTCMGNAISSRP